MRPAKGLFLSELVDFAITHLSEDMDFIDEDDDDFDYSDYDFEDEDYNTDTSNYAEKTMSSTLNNPSKLK